MWANNRTGALIHSNFVEASFWFLFSQVRCSRQTELRIRIVLNMWTHIGESDTSLRRSSNSRVCWVFAAHQSFMMYSTLINDVHLEFLDNQADQSKMQRSGLNSSVFCVSTNRLIQFRLSFDSYINRGLLFWCQMNIDLFASHSANENKTQKGNESIYLAIFI